MNGSDARAWTSILASYCRPSNGRAIFELVITIVPLAVLWVTMWASLAVGYWVTLLLAFPTAGFLVRLFMIQHDCGHRSFARDRKINDWIGRCIGVLTLTPYACWRRSHAAHHSSSGNLDRRGIGDIETITVEEYFARPPLARLRYRMYRHPLVMFGLGPAYLFMLRHRLPLKASQSWISSMGTNLTLALIVAVLVWLIGATAFLLVYLPVVLLAASAGVWLFYVQHQFEHTLWKSGEEWTLHDAALYGSSHYDLPLLLRWVTANIGLHHVHHLCSRIPYYRLPLILRDHPEFRHVGRVTLRQSLRCVRLSLWDETQRRLVSFRDLDVCRQ